MPRATKDSTCDLMAIGARMRDARTVIGLGQSEFASKNDLVPVTYRRNENGQNEAGICLVGAFIAAGINANWLLTGEGPMLLKDIAAIPAGALDPSRLRLAIEAVEEGLAASGRVMAPGKKAELVLAVYDLFTEPANTKERILKLVKLAA